MSVAAVVCAALAAAGCTARHPSTVAATAHPAPSGVGTAQPRSTTPAPGAATSGDSLFPADGNGGYDVTHYAITISYDPATKTLRGTDTVTAVATQALSRFDLDLHELTVSSVTVSNVPATFSRAADKLVVTPKSPLADGARFAVTIRYGGVPKPYDDPTLGFEGFIPEPDGALAQGEPQVAAS